MKPLEALFPDILPDVPACPPAMALVALRNTVTDFCEQTLIHQATLDPLTLIPGVAEYDLEPPSGYRVGQVVNVWFKGQKLEPLSPDMVEMPEAYGDFIGGYKKTQAPPKGYAQRTPETITFLPFADQRYVGAVTMRVALVPLRDCTEIEDFLYEQYGEYLAAGAKARLMISPGKPYSNKELAAAHAARYMSARNDAKLRARAGYGRPNLRVKLRKP
jgi:hypothetical protein